MLIAGFASAYTATNCYVVAAAAGEQCVIVDPGLEVIPELDELLREHRLLPVAVMLTHGHVDHSASVLPLCQARDVPAYIHPDDRAQLSDPWTWLGMPKGAPVFGQLNFGEPADVRPLTDHATVDLAGMSFTVRHAPGHTQGSVVFDIHEHLFAGDVLFAGSIGRCDLPGGSMAAMNRSLREVILPMDDEITVLPGHGPATTIGRERMTNPYLKALI